MKKLFLFLYRIRAFLVFVLLQIVCIVLIIQNNSYQSALFFNSSNSAVAGVLSISNNVSNFVELEDINQQLASENALLKEQLNRNYVPANLQVDTVLVDSIRYLQYIYKDARVVNNSTKWTANYITIDKGSKDGIQKGMGVVNQNGAIGQVNAVSKNYSVVTSLLHRDLMVSSVIKRTDALGTIRWSGEEPSQIDLLYVPISSDVHQGDSIVTSGFNSVFPKNILIGVVKEVVKGEGASYLGIKVALSNDFRNLSYVYIIDNQLRLEKDSLESVVTRDENF